MSMTKTMAKLKGPHTGHTSSVKTCQNPELLMFSACGCFEIGNKSIVKSPRVRNRSATGPEHENCVIKTKGPQHFGAARDAEL